MRIPSIKQFLPKNVKIGKLTDMALGMKYNKFIKKGGNADDFVKNLDTKADEINTKFIQSFVENDGNINSDKVKAKIFSYIPFITKPIMKLSYVEKEFKYFDSMKISLKEMFNKPLETIISIREKILVFMDDILKTRPKVAE